TFGRIPSRAIKKILVVDDGPESLNDFWLLLEEVGYQVIHCGGSLAALFAVVRVEPDLVIAEFRVPVMNGLALAHELKAHEDTRRVPVVLLAAQDNPKCRTAAVQAGCAGYLTLNLSPDDFLDDIAKVLVPPLPKRSADISGVGNSRRHLHKSPGLRYALEN